MSLAIFLFVEETLADEWSELFYYHCSFFMDFAKIGIMKEISKDRE
jgi:hypothetical protein